MKMKTSYYGDGRIERTTEDGRRWREASPQELSELAPDDLVFFGTGEPKPAGVYADWYFPGHYPFLPGLAALRPVYIEVRD